MEPQVVSLNNISLSFNPEKAKGVYRESFVGGLESLMDKGNTVIILEGEPGIGKTTVLSQLAEKHRFDCISYFANRLNKSSFSPDFVTEDLGRQFHFVLKGVPPSDESQFSVSTINAMHIELAKALKKRRKKLLIVLDGLDQITPSELEQLKPVLEVLPWDSPQASIIISGDAKYLNSAYSEVVTQKSENLRVLQFTSEETKSFFGTLIPDEVSLREIHKTWRGNPERLSDIKRILSRGVTVEQFLNEDIVEKNRLLDIEWNESFNSINEDWQFLALAIVCFDSTVTSISSLSNIISIDIDKINLFFNYLSYLKKEGDSISFITTSLKDFAASKLKKYEDRAYDTLVNYYSTNINQSSIASLTGHYEKKMAWGKTIDLLSIDNLTKIVTKSTSFSDIKNQIILGHKASIKHKDLVGSQGAFDNVFKFSLYRSVLLELQGSDTREAEIQSCVALKEYDQAISVATGAFLKEDRLKMLITYAKECALRKVTIDPVILDDITSKCASVDLDYISENIIEIATNLGYFLPKLAIELIEKATEGNKGNSSLEWLLTYLSALTSKTTNKTQDIQDMSSDNTQNDVLSTFFSSFGRQNEKIQIEDIKVDINRFSSSSDKLYMSRVWIKNNENNKYVFEIMNLALDFLLEDSSNTKPTTTVLLDISKPVAKATDINSVNSFVQRVEGLIQTVNTPTIDLIKLQLVIIEAQTKTNLRNANEKLFKLVSYIKELEDSTIKAESYAHCWKFLEDIYSDGFQEKELIYRAKEAQTDLSNELDIILNSIAQQHRELEYIIKVVSITDIKFAIELIQKVNTLSRRNWCYITCLESYATKPMNEWDTNAIAIIFRKVKDEDALGHLLLSLMDAAYNQTNSEIDGRHKFLLTIQNIKSLENSEIKCVLLIKSISVLLNSYKPKIGLVRNYNKVVDQLKLYLNECWSKIENPWIRVKSAYKISSTIADADYDLAKTYYSLAKIAEENLFVDNMTYASAFIKSIFVAINSCTGAMKCGLKPDYSKLEYLIDKINSPLDQVTIWAEFAVKSYLADAKSVSERIVAEKIVPVIDAYISEKKESFYLSSLIVNSASALYLAQRANLMLLLGKLSGHQLELAIDNIIYVLLYNVYEGDPYESSKGHADIKFQAIADIVELMSFIEDDNFLFTVTGKVCHTAQEMPALLSREHRVALKQTLSALIAKKLPNTKTGIKHEGYLIVCEAYLTHLDISFSEVEYTKFFNGLKERAEKIENTADKVFILNMLASECNSKLKKLRQEFLDLAFNIAEKIPSYREKFDRYVGLLTTAKDVSEALFSNKIKEINQEILAIDNKDLFPTHRRIIDLAFQHDKTLASKLISVLDTDPGRKAMTFPAAKHLEKIKLENDAVDDYSKFGRLRTRSQVRDIAWKNLGQLNSDKKMTKPIEQTTLLLTTAARTPFSYAMPVFDLFIQNIIKKVGSNSKYKVAISNMYLFSLYNAQLTFDIISNLSLKKSYIPIIFSLKQSEAAYSVKPGQRQAAIEFIANFFSELEHDEIYIIDSYISEKDTRFLRSIVESSPKAHVIVMTSLEGSKGKVSIDRPAFIQEWKNVSDDPLPSMTVIRVNKADQTSPFHDRYILSRETGLGLKIGSSINSIGGGKVFGITVMSKNEIDSVYESTIEPFANQRVKVYGKDKIKYESFDL